MSIRQSHFSVSNFVDVVVEQLVNEVDMGQEHPPAAVSTEAQLVQYFADVDSLLGVPILVALTHQEAELVPFVSNHLAAAEASDWNYHVDERNIINRPDLISMNFRYMRTDLTPYYLY